ncbi:MAG: TIM barrel protein [Pseudomonadota bacterium]
MAKFSANLGFLWKTLTLPQAIRIAANSGFDAVECHFPYEQPAEDVKAALAETGLPMIALNTVRGNVEAGDFGLCAVPGREAEAEAAIRQAIDYAKAVGARNVHIMAGTSAGNPWAEATFLNNLRLAAELATSAGIGVLIEPINHRDVPNYFLNTVEQAAGLIRTLVLAPVRMMFDLYHVQVTQGDILRRLEEHMPAIGHIQIAGAPGRNEPDTGEIAIDRILDALGELGYEGYVGAEYIPKATEAEGLGWLQAFRGGA